MALEKATITNTATGKTIPVMFNPEKYSMSKSNSFSELSVPGLESPIIQFSKGNTQSLSMELFFDTYEDRSDVRDYTNQIEALMDIDSNIMAPPICIFSWGSFTFKCVIDSISKNFEMFLSSGIPVRATLNVSFKEYKSPEEHKLANPTKSITSLTEKVVSSGETLASIATAKFSDPKKWKELAKINNLENPRKLAAGIKLNIPSKEQIEKQLKQKAKKEAKTKVKQTINEIKNNLF